MLGRSTPKNDWQSRTVTMLEVLNNFMKKRLISIYFCISFAVKQRSLPMSISNERKATECTSANTYSSVIAKNREAVSWRRTGDPQFRFGMNIMYSSADSVSDILTTSSTSNSSVKFTSRLVREYETTMQVQLNVSGIDGDRRMHDLPTVLSRSHDIKEYPIQQTEDIDSCSNAVVQ